MAATTVVPVVPADEKQHSSYTRVWTPFGLHEGTLSTQKPR